MARLTRARVGEGAAMGRGDVNDKLAVTSWLTPARVGEGTILSPAERALFTERRKEAYEALHPETKHGQNQHTRSRQAGDSNDPAPRFTADTASKTGQSERAIQRDAARGVTPS